MSNSVSFENLMNIIKTWNAIYSSGTGSMSANVADLIEAGKVIESAQWKPANGAMTGSRYFECEHGIVVQRPQPSNEMSLIPKDTAKLLGII